MAVSYISRTNAPFFHLIEREEKGEVRCEKGYIMSIYIQNLSHEPYRFVNYRHFTLFKTNKIPMRG
ncbi:MAG: hypothetical protein BAJATHORv1_10342 [Candidatus Thorarchaeota archaeon]|nr:MAG: hypothetical protein BAJATHORv1_10342 [Candidatus Thorarchaeota archaeon]